MVRRFTQISVEKIRPHPTKRLEVPDPGKPGLYLVVQTSGKKSWAVRYRLFGKPKKLTLDGFPSLGVARRLAQVALDSVAEGKDPAAEKIATRVASHSDRFSDVAEEFLERHIKPKSRASYAYETERMLRKEVLPLWGKKRIQEITKQDVVTLLNEIVDRGGGVTANRVLSAVRKLFNWAQQERGIVIPHSPVAGLRKPLNEVSRDRTLTHGEIKRLWIACDKVGYPFGSLTQLLLLTAQRRNEVAGMVWAEVDLDKREWLIPGERTKNKELHTVPLSKPAAQLIKSLPRMSSERGYVFTTNGKTQVSGFSRGKADIDAAMKSTSRWTLHDLRRTAASGMAQLGMPLPVIEKVLNHSSGSFAGVVAVYQRHHFSNEKRHALEAWGALIKQLSAG